MSCGRSWADMGIALDVGHEPREGKGPILCCGLRAGGRGRVSGIFFTACGISTLAPSIVTHLAHIPHLSFVDVRFIAYNKNPDNNPHTAPYAQPTPTYTPCFSSLCLWCHWTLCVHTRRWRSLHGPLQRSTVCPWCPPRASSSASSPSPASSTSYTRCVHYGLYGMRWDIA